MLSLLELKSTKMHHGGSHSRVAIFMYELFWCCHVMWFFFTGHFWLLDENLWIPDTRILEGDSFYQIPIPRVHWSVGKTNREDPYLGGGEGGCLIYKFLIFYACFRNCYLYVACFIFGFEGRYITLCILISMF